MKKTKENGITLIALIITIIVMLILVGMTVNVALNGGLFSTAKQAVNETQIELDRDALLSAVVGAIGNNGEVDFSVLDKNLPEGFTGSNGTYTSKSGNKFKVDKNGTITYIENGNEQETEDEDLALLKRYFLGDNGEVKDFMSLLDFENIGENGEIFIDDPSSPENERELLSFIEDSVVSDDKGAFYVKCNEKIYRVVVKIENPYPDTIYITENVDLIYKRKGREGEIVKYDSNNDGTQEDWMILYDNGDNVEMISMDVMGGLTLGYEDENAQIPGDIDKDGTENTNIDKTIYSYNNAIERVNSYCSSLVTNDNKISVRSVGSNPDNPSYENNELYSSENITKWNSAYNAIGKSSDTNLEQDLVRMIYYNIKNKEASYWLASRTVNIYVSTSRVSFIINYVLAENEYNFGQLWSVVDNGYISHSSYAYGVRPVVKVSSDKI